MNSLLKYREVEYFDERKDHHFVFQTINPLIKCSKLTFEKGYWFTFRGIGLKATTTPCISLNDLKGMKVMYKDYPLIKGTLGGWGLCDSPFIYVFWGQVPFRDNLYNFAHMTPNAGKILGFPNALEDMYNLIKI